MKLGLIVNPIAGLGGPVGLKGTDHKVAEAIALGARERAHPRAVAFLRACYAADDDITIYTAGGRMGEDACAEAVPLYEVVAKAAEIVDKLLV